ncbi:MAG: helix-turn-helix domain-containing protein [Planctomycetia bacterium]|nr:helix-turn-helix domain-containing protein [Planctomycetia bacterium]
MATNDSCNPAGQFALELVEILKRLGAHRRAVYEQTYGNPPWTREQSNAYWYHPLVRMCEWLELRLGISRHDLEDAAFRLTTPQGLRGMGPLTGPSGRTTDAGQPDLLWMITKFRELDGDGTTARLWQSLVEKYPAILAHTGMLAPLGNGGDERSTPVELFEGLKSTAEKFEQRPAVDQTIPVAMQEKSNVANEGWVPVLPDEFIGHKYCRVGETFTTPNPNIPRDADTESLARLTDGRYALIIVSGRGKGYKWSFISEARARDLAMPVSQYRSMRNWQDVIDQPSSQWESLSVSGQAVDTQTDAGNVHPAEPASTSPILKKSEHSTEPGQVREAESTSWITVTEAAKVTGANRGVISRAVDKKELKGKGKGRKRRICPADLTRWQLARANRPEPQESDAMVKEKLRRLPD